MQIAARASVRWIFMDSCGLSADLHVGPLAFGTASWLALRLPAHLGRL